MSADSETASYTSATASRPERPQPQPRRAPAPLACVPPPRRVRAAAGPDEQNSMIRRHIALVPAQLVQPGVVDAEVVGDLVYHGHADLLDDVLLGVADGQDRVPVDDDPVG